jgi:hypothetical protein
MSWAMQVSLFESMLVVWNESTKFDYSIPQDQNQENTPTTRGAINSRNNRDDKEERPYHRLDALNNNIGHWSKSVACGQYDFHDDQNDCEYRESQLDGSSSAAVSVSNSANMEVRSCAYFKACSTSPEKP